MVFFFEGHIFDEPVRWGESVGGFLCGKLHLGEDHAGEGPGEEIQLNREDVVQRDEIAPFGDDIAVGFGLEVLVGFPGEGQVVLLVGHHAAGLVGENVAVVLAADADHRSGTEIGLLDIVVGVSFQIFPEAYGSGICVRFP